MEKIIGFDEFMRQNYHNVKKHKMKPAHLESVTGGVQKRLENNLKHRKSSRLSMFDRLRSIPQSESPPPVPVISKVEHRKQQFEKWKADKEKRKKEEAAKKKKPFLTGVPHVPLKFVPPPPPPQKVKPSTSGRVTRSQAAQIAKQTETQVKEANASSFAPQNALFHPPAMKNVSKLHAFGAPKAKKDKKSVLVLRFEPVLLATEAKQTRSKTKQNAVETRATHKPIDTKNKITKQAKPVYSLKSSSSSELENLQKQNVKTKATRKPIDNKSKLAKPMLMLVDSIQSHQVASSSSSETPSPRNTPNRKSRKFVQVNTPNKSIPKSESSSEERLRSPKSLEVVSMTPEQIAKEAWKISPKVTMSRGKDSARKEAKMKLKEGLLDDDASDIDNVDHFRKQLASEIKRMTEMCDTWDRISEQNVLPEAIQEHLLTAVGQARLLMSQKLAQFASLIERCARPEPGSALVTPADLHGFWDMVFMQVENVDIRFKKLEEMRSRGWKEEPVVKPRIVKPTVKPTVKPAVKPAGGQSRLKEMIAAARKAKKDQTAPTATETEEKTFEAGFFRVSSPVRSSAPSTPIGKPSLLKAVLSNEAKKSASKQNTPFAMLRASVLAKGVECDGVAPLPITPKPQMVLGIPGRSILKDSDTAKKSVKKSAKKSIKTVLFCELDDSMEDETEKAPDSGISSMKVNQKENRPSLQRQDAVESESIHNMMTRSMRQHINNGGDTPKTTGKSVDKDEETPRPRGKSLNIVEETPRTRGKSVNKDKITPRTRGRVLEELEKNIPPNMMPKRSSRRSRTGEEITSN